MTITRSAVLGIISALVSTTAVTGAALAVSAAPAHADTPVMHNVKYTVAAANPIFADIYYLDQQPPIFSDYSHNPYQFVPHVQADIAAGRPWTSDVVLSNPDEYAMVSVSTGNEPGTPMFHCDLAVDGVVVRSKDGPKGVLCSLRNW